ncbi:hypothetical protein [Acuticoccus sediminis]|uniref:hypothetical protein n=1 Tax=Acuticoccus sediminis TaxID=2184697 RepID=UPI001CFE626D|nr:hypothetical protein [Acuticoccus sediminis]
MAVSIEVVHPGNDTEKYWVANFEVVPRAGEIVEMPDVAGNLVRLRVTWVVHYPNNLEFDVRIYTEYQS